MLFSYPAKVVPEAYAAGPAFYSSAVMFAAAALAAGGLAAFRDDLADRVAGSSAVVAGACALFLVCGAALILSAGIGAAPSWMMAAYPVVVALYGMVLAVALLDASRRLAPRDNAVVLSLSLLLSFLIGLGLATLTDPLPTGDISSFLMLVLSGVFLVAWRRLDCGPAKPSAPPRSVSPLSGRIAALTAAILLCYLLGSGAFMSLSSVARGETWFSDGWIHCVLGLVLYLVFCLYVLAAWRRGRAAYPWLGFFILCIACLYCTALFYSSLAVLCRGVILPSRPMAIVLLWAVVWEGMRARDRAWWLTAAVAPLLIFAVDCGIHAIGLVGLASEQMDSVVNAIMLGTAFVMTLGMLWFVRLRFGGVPTAADSADSECVASDSGVPTVLAALADGHGLSERESEVLGLLYRGNTQKKIAEHLFLSVSSVQTYAKSLYRKLGVHSRQELIDMVNEAVRENGRAR